MYCIPLVGSLFQVANNTINDSADSLGELAIETHNNLFEQYEGSNIRGATVNGLLQTIKINNESNSDEEDNNISQINFNGEEFEPTEENITLIKSEIDVGSTYSVECENDENTGLINRIVINKK